MLTHNGNAWKKKHITFPPPKKVILHKFLLLGFGRLKRIVGILIHVDRVKLMSVIKAVFVLEGFLLETHRERLRGFESGGGEGGGA